MGSNGTEFIFELDGLTESQSNPKKVSMKFIHKVTSAAIPLNTKVDHDHPEDFLVSILEELEDEILPKNAQTMDTRLANCIGLLEKLDLTQNQPLSNQIEDVRTQYNQKLAPPRKQTVVLKTIEIDDQGTAKTVQSTKKTSSTMDTSNCESDSEKSYMSSSLESYEENEYTPSNTSSTQNRLEIPLLRSSNRSRTSSSSTTSSNPIARGRELLEEDDLKQFSFGLEYNEDDICQVAEIKRNEPVFGEKMKYTLQPTPQIIPRMVPTAGKKVFGMVGSSLKPWVPGKVLQVYHRKSNGDLEYRVQLAIKRGAITEKETRIITGKHLAYSLKTPFLLGVGFRVIARYVDEYNKNKPIDYTFYAGIVAERPSSQNRHRYLIFFDDGCAQYVSVDYVFLTCQTSKNVWEDCHPDIQDFVKDYVIKYPERPMVRLTKGQLVSTEWNGTWFVGRVVEVDSSLVKIHFESDNRYEWIYRGSTRLAPLFNKIKKSQTSDVNEKQNPIKKNGVSLKISSSNRNDTVPNDGSQKNRKSSESKDALSLLGPKESITIHPVKSNHTARKSTSAPPRLHKSPSSNSNSSVNRNEFNGLYNGSMDVELSNSKSSDIDESVKTLNRPNIGSGVDSLKLIEYEGRMNRVFIPSHIRGPSKYEPHRCKPSCVRLYRENDTRINTINPLSLPMYYGWAREIAKTPRRFVFYRAPCGRRLRDIEELYSFLILTKYNMGIDHFCFDYTIDCCNEFTPERTYFLTPDITHGKEAVPVQCCNSINSDYPEYVQYSKSRLCGKGVVINTDPEFLSCCDCTDDCSDKEKCSCWRMTMAGLNMANDEYTLEVGYQYRRLMDHCVTGIYECNSRCSCKSTCLNRVVQHEMKWQLQIFRTSNKGWAIRPVHDIPQGAFICIYAGQVLTDSSANEDGKAFGDEYLAELDYIEVCERHKEGYESKAIENESTTNRLNNERKRKHDVITGEIDDDEDNINTYWSQEDFDIDRISSRRPTRELFGNEEYCYIMDAKSIGNIGRYLNHSCQPNVFVQNVFVDTHDLRFPWVAFFAFKNIRAGTELTWDYSYEIGSVPGKTMYCYCGTPECRGRLL